MIIDFKKVPFTKSDFESSFDGLTLKGEFNRENPTLVKIDAHLKGSIKVDCYRCATEFNLDIDEDLELFISDGVYKSEDSLDIIEVEDSKIDFDKIIASEIESIKSDYHSCGNCDEIEEFEF
jgi:uncharacterized metal-binding protein YceD (DUF177 family)